MEQNADSHNTTPSDGLNWRRLISGWFGVGLLCFVVVVAAAIIEHRVLLPHRALDAGDMARMAAAGFFFGFAPAVLLSAVSCWLRGLELPVWVRHLLVWLPTLLGAGGSLLAYAYVGAWTLDSAKIALIVGAATAVWWARDRAEVAGLQPPYWLMPVGVAWLAAAVGFNWLIVELPIDPATTTFQWTVDWVPMAIGLFWPLLCVVYASVERWWPTLGRATGAVVGAVAIVTTLAATFIIFDAVHHKLAGLYLPLKASLSLSAALAIGVVFAPIIGRWAKHHKLVVYGSSALPLVGAAAVVWIAFAFIPRAFGPSTPRSLVGHLVRAVHVWHDMDGDGFYSTDAGGNDCDDTDPQVTPVAPSVERNCWARLGVQPDQQPAAQGQLEKAAPVEHVVVIIVDALRGDLARSEEFERYENLARFRDESVFFERAYAPGNSTFLSIGALMRNVSPVTLVQTTLGGVADEQAHLKEHAESRAFFDIGQSPSADERRFCTGLLAHIRPGLDWPLDIDESRLDTVVVDHSQSSTGHTAPSAPGNVERMLETCGQRPVLAMVYLDDPHRENADFEYTCRDGSMGQQRCYREEIGVVDDAIGEVFSMLEDRGMLDTTLVAITSDHGEAFGEHNHHGHTSTVYEEQIHVPLMLRIPNTAPARIDTPVSLLALQPTIEDLAGLRSTPAPLYPSLAGLIDGRSEHFPSPIAENWLGFHKRGWTAPTSALISGDYKLIYDWTTTAVELYDLSEDPAEQHDLARSEPERVRELLVDFQDREAFLITGASK